MKTFGIGRTLLATATCLAPPLLVADEVSLNKDLMAVIALQGLSCGKVVSAERRGDNDYVASCADGNRYHVFVDSGGRVVVQKE